MNYISVRKADNGYIITVEVDTERGFSEVVSVASTPAKALKIVKKAIVGVKEVDENA